MLWKWLTSPEFRWRYALLRMARADAVPGEHPCVVRDRMGHYADFLTAPCRKAD